MKSTDSSADRQGKPPNTGWFWVDNVVTESITTIGASAILVYLVLAKHADDKRQCYPSGKTLSELSGLAKRSVWRAVAKLESRGWISVDRGTDVSGVRHPNRYTLLPLRDSDTGGTTPNQDSDTGDTTPNQDSDTGDTTPNQDSDTGDTTGSDTGDTRVVTAEHQEQDPLNKTPRTRPKGGWSKTTVKSRGRPDSGRT